MFLPRSSLDSPAPEFPCFLLGSPTSSQAPVFPHSRDPPRFLSLRGFQSANSSLTHLPRPPAAACRPSSTPPDNHQPASHSTPPPPLSDGHQHCSLGLASFCFLFSPAPGLTVYFSLLNAFGHHHPLSVSCCLLGSAHRSPRFIP